MFAPWRHSYVNQLPEASMSGCVFCVAFKKGISFESQLIFESENSGIILNKYPYNNGHIMVIPKNHTAEIEALSAEEYDDLHQTLKMAHNLLRKAYNPHGMNLGMNLGRVGGAGIIDHMHYHLVPRWGGDTNFMPIIGQTKVISESLEQTYKKLITLINGKQK